MTKIKWKGWLRLGCLSFVFVGMKVSGSSTMDERYPSFYLVQGVQKTEEIPDQLNSTDLQAYPHAEIWSGEAWCRVYDGIEVRHQGEVNWSLLRAINDIICSSKDQWFFREKGSNLWSRLYVFVGQMIERIDGAWIFELSGRHPDEWNSEEELRLRYPGTKKISGTSWLESKCGNSREEQLSSLLCGRFLFRQYHIQEEDKIIPFDLFFTQILNSFLDKIETGDLVEIPSQSFIKVSLAEGGEVVLDARTMSLDSLIDWLRLAPLYLLDQFFVVFLNASGKGIKVVPLIYLLPCGGGNTEESWKSLGRAIQNCLIISIKNKDWLIRIQTALMEYSQKRNGEAREKQRSFDYLWECFYGGSDSDEDDQLIEEPRPIDNQQQSPNCGDSTPPGYKKLQENSIYISYLKERGFMFSSLYKIDLLYVLNKNNNIESFSTWLNRHFIQIQQGGDIRSTNPGEAVRIIRSLPFFIREGQ